MKILLTGGAGFIGSHVAAAFLAAGHRVVVVDDLSAGDRARVPPGAAFHRADVASAEFDAIVAAEHPDVVDHHAAQISVTASARDPLADARTNALGTLNVLEACRRNAVRKMIFISSGGAIYGDADVERIPETWPPAPLSPYAIHKLTGEHYLRFYRAQYGLRSTSLRYANVYGPGQDPDGEAGVVAIFCTKLQRGETPVLNAYPDDPAGMARDYVFVEDVAAANVLALDKGDGDAFNIGTGVPVKTREVLEGIARLLGKEARFTPAPARPGDLRRSCLDNRRAREVLGWRPTHDLAAGLAKTVAWFTTHA
jgi:UDP-glucose 4-epimerase